jgi:hypothetical protein
VMMERHDEESLRCFEETVQAIPEVLECHLVTGPTAWLASGTPGQASCYAASSASCRPCRCDRGAGVQITASQRRAVSALSKWCLSRKNPNSTPKANRP